MAKKTAAITPPKGTQTFKKSLQCKLTDTEIQAKGRKASKFQDEAEEIAEKLKLMGKEHRDDLKQKKGELRGLLKDIGNGAEDRDVVCFEDKDFKAGSITIIRTDTGMVVETRTMTGEERQEKLFEGKTGPSGKLLSIPPGTAPAKKRGRKSNAQKAAEAALAAGDAAPEEPLEN